MVAKLNSYIKIIFQYAKYHWLYTTFGFYFILSIILFSYCNINIAIPCLIRLVTGHECPGCGLTHAFAHILQLNFSEAWADNKIAFIILPAGLYYFLKDLDNFSKTVSKTN